MLQLVNYIVQKFSIFRVYFKHGTLIKSNNLSTKWTIIVNNSIHKRKSNNAPLISKFHWATCNLILNVKSLVISKIFHKSCHWGLLQVMPKIEYSKGHHLSKQAIRKIDWISPPSQSISAQEDRPYSLNFHHEKQLLLRTSNNCKIIGSLTLAYWSNDPQRNCHHH